MAALDTGDQPLTVLAATSGDTGSAVAHAFHGVPHTRVVVLYPDGRVSPTQEAQLTMFNAEDGNVRAYAVAGSFDDCHRITQEAFGRPRAAGARPADVRQFGEYRPAAAADGLLLSRGGRGHRSLTEGGRMATGTTSVRRVSAADSSGAAAARQTPSRTSAVPPDITVCTQRKLRQSHGGAHGQACRPAHRAVRGGHQRQRRRARISVVGSVRAAAVGADDCQRDGCRQPEQLRAHVVAVPRRSRRHAAGYRRQPSHRR